jgi:hypothetical protein
MRRFIGIVSAFALPILLYACVGGEVETVPEGVDVPEINDEVKEEPESLINKEDLVTHNVTYTGILEEGGVTIYQEGSHRLMLSDGKMVLLETSKEAEGTALNLYVGKLVSVKGDVMPTVEAGGTLMEVKNISWIRREEDSDGDDVEMLRVLCGGESSAVCPEGYVCELSEEGPGVCKEGDDVDEDEEDLEEDADDSEEAEDMDDDPAAESFSADSGEAGDEIPEDLDDDENEEDSEEPVDDEPVSQDENTEALELMTDEDYAGARWTQEYCSTHIGFCVPVHKNWYFRSFGATASVLWHVEMGALSIESFGDGPLVVSLKSGVISSLGVEDGAVKTVGSEVIGYRAWGDSSYFEISAPSSLNDPVTFVTNGLKASEAE